MYCSSSRVFLLGLMVVTAIKLVTAAISDHCIRCLAKVELGTDGECVMDQGSPSCGLYQIKEPYWIDCGKPGDSYLACTADRQCAEQCIRDYTKRYAGNCRKAHNREHLTCIHYGRMHNGGPNGCSASWTAHYVELMNRKCQDEFELEKSMADDRSPQVVDDVDSKSKTEQVKPKTTGHVDGRQGSEHEPQVERVDNRESENQSPAPQTMGSATGADAADNSDERQKKQYYRRFREMLLRRLRQRQAMRRHNKQ